ncbi:hypothetical protein [uncultured Roseibium sp.]
MLSLADRRSKEDKFSDKRRRLEAIEKNANDAMATVSRIGEAA